MFPISSFFWIVYHTLLAPPKSYLYVLFKCHGLDLLEYFNPFNYDFLMKTFKWMSSKPQLRCHQALVSSAVALAMQLNLWQSRHSPAMMPEGPKLIDIMVWTSCKTQPPVSFPPRRLIIAPLSSEVADWGWALSSAWGASACPSWTRLPVNHQGWLLHLSFEVIQHA